MRTALRALAAALTFLTVLPLGRWVRLEGADVARGSVAFPLVGAGIGAATGATAYLLDGPLPPVLAAVCGVVVMAALTGALHLDGLADCADGFGGRTVEDRLRIMRDHTIGTYGATALLLDLLVRVTALAALADSADAVLFATAAGAVARLSGPVYSVALPHAQGSAAAEAISTRPSRGRSVAAVLLAVLVSVLCLGPDAWAPLLVTVVVLVLVGLTARARLRGVTGDVMGAASELVDIATLTLLVALS